MEQSHWRLTACVAPKISHPPSQPIPLRFNRGAVLRGGVFHQGREHRGRDGGGRVMAHEDRMAQGIQPMPGQKPAEA